MKHVFAILFILFTTQCTLNAQSFFPIQLTVLGFPNQEIYIAQISGDHYRITDTLLSDSQGIFECSFDASYSVGMYVFLFPQFQNTEIDFIFNKEAVSFKTNIGNIHSNLQIVSSVENTLLYSFRTHYVNFLNDIALLEQIYDSYSDDAFKKNTHAEYTKKIKHDEEFVSLLLKNHHHTFAAQLIKSSRIPHSPQLVSAQERHEYAKQNFLHAVNFADTLLCNSTVFTEKAIKYLSLYAKERTRSNPHAALKQAVDIILAKAHVHPTTYSFIVNYLLDGFETMGDTEMLMYISSLYISESQCEHSESTTTLERKALQNVHYTIGSAVPAYSAQTISGTTIHSTLSKDAIEILVFWATWCGHCTELTPKIATLYAKNPNVNYSLTFISLDTEEAVFSSFLSEHQHLANSNNVFDSKGWDSKLAEDFYVYASPTIFIIKNGIIVAKPIDYESYTNALLQLGIL
ncbi:MAG: thioredoxin domain-containing protein [Bacteroidales bacterium]|nr:thioredoxin domain-containing protein [Bacteroidales bacterium]NLK81441.1 redoxin domain-containing protein [Bacteroidales bacterium]